MSDYKIDYTSKDYASIRRDLLARIPGLTSKWTDHNPSDLGMVLLELLAGLGDMLAYNLDAEANECFLETAIRRESIFTLARYLGYEPQGPVAASTTLRFSLSVPAELDIWIPEGTACKAEGGDSEVYFYTTETGVMRSGETFVDLPARQGLAASETHYSYGRPYHRLTLTRTDVDMETISVTVDHTPWERVSGFHDSDAQSLHFQAGLDFKGRAEIRFSDGIRGAIPRDGARIEVSFHRTLGPGGNLAPGTIETLVLPLGNVSVINTGAAVGGAEAESLDSIRLKAPAIHQSVWRAVTRKDFEALACSVPGVLKAQVIESLDRGDLHYRRALVAILPEGGGLPSTPLLARTQAFLDARRPITIDVEVIAPEFVAIPVAASVTARAGYDETEIQTDIAAALRDFFSLEKARFGMGIYRSDLTALIDGVRGVSHLTLQEPVSNLHLDSGQWPLLGNTHMTFTRERG